MIKKILNIQTKTISSAAFVLGAASFISAVLGLFKNRLLAGAFGAGNELDIYYASFRIPDFITMVLIMGAISAAIIPVFSEHLIRSRDDAWKFLSNLLNLFLFFLIFISIILFIFTPQLISLIAPGFGPEKKALTIVLTRIMFFSPVLLGISNIISGTLRVFQRFLVTSLCPILYNIGIIFGLLFLVPLMGLKGLAWGVVLGGFLHLLIQIPILVKLGFRPKIIFNIKEPGFLKVIKLTIPRSIGLAASQINFIVVTAIASCLVAGSIAIFNLAESLSRPILILIAVSYSAAAFPSMSLAFSKKNKKKLIKIFYNTFYKTLFLLVFLSLLLFFLRETAVRIILKVGHFSQADVRLTSACLGMFCIGLFAQGIILLVSKAFYAIQNTKIPALTSVAGMIINIALCFLFIKLLSFPNFFKQFFCDFLNLQNLENIQIVGLPLALSLSAIIQFTVLLIFLKYKIKSFKYEKSI